MIALDSNILLYAEALLLVPADIPKHRLTQALIPGIRQAGLILPAQVLGELFTVLVRRGRRPPAMAKQAAQRWAAVAAVVPATDPSTMLQAIALATEQGLQIWDAVILAAAAEAGATMLLSEDMQDGFSWRGVTVANPFAATPHPLVDRLLA
jgi:predicted nucleic acid-binding protein